MATARADPDGAQPNDPAWVRLLFVLVEGCDGQWWRAILLMAPFLLLVAALAVIMAEFSATCWLVVLAVSLHRHWRCAGKFRRRQNIGNPPEAMISDTSLRSGEY